MRYLIQAPGQPNAYGDYLDETEALNVVRSSGLVDDMRKVVVTQVFEKTYNQYDPIKLPDPNV
jgi:hypothetical protein